MLNQTMEQLDPLLMSTFSIIIPAYNEENRIGPVLEEISSFVSMNRLPWEVIVEIDGNDQTREIVNEFSKKNPFIMAEVGSKRGGKGNAIKRGILQARGEFIILMDSDAAVAFSDILTGMSELQWSDMVLLERYTKRDNGIPLMRRIASRGFNLLVRGLLGLRIKDTQTGYKLLRTDIAKKAMESVSVTNTFYDVALLYKISKMDGRISELAVRYRHDGNSKFNVASEIIGQGISLLAFRVRYSPLYKYIPATLKEIYYKKFRWI